MTIIITDTVIHNYADTATGTGYATATVIAANHATATAFVTYTATATARYGE